MTEYTPSTYGDTWAEIYDEATSSPAGEVELLAELAGDGPVLELGVGTGRVAAPLAERGLAVHGLDPSQGMPLTPLEAAKINKACFQKLGYSFRS